MVAYRIAQRPIQGRLHPTLYLVPLLEYPKRWPAANWTLAFQGNVHVLSDEDYQIIEDAVRGK